MFGGVVELDAAQNSSGFDGRECLVERAAEWVDRLSCTTWIHRDNGKRDFLRTVTPALLTDGLRIEGGI